jgi:CBS domain-containing protein
MMTEHTVRRLLVISHEHALVGIVTLPDVGGIEPPRKKSVKVTFHKEKTDSYGRPHKVEVKTVYITSVRGKEAAEAAAVKHVEQEAGTAWTNVATGFESREEPNGKSPPSG